MRIEKKLGPMSFRLLGLGLRCPQFPTRHEGDRLLACPVSIFICAFSCWGRRPRDRATWHRLTNLLADPIALAHVNPKP